MSSLLERITKCSRGTSLFFDTTVTWELKLGEPRRHPPWPGLYVCHPPTPFLPPPREGGLLAVVCGPPPSCSAPLCRVHLPLVNGPLVCPGTKEGPEAPASPLPPARSPLPAAAEAGLYVPSLPGFSVARRCAPRASDPWSWRTPAWDRSVGPLCSPHRRLGPTPA